MYQVVYLTGAPAVGKSSLTRALNAAVSPLEVFEYGDRLTKFLMQKHGSPLSQEELRTKSSLIATPADIQALDRVLLDFIESERQRTHIVIDSHAVTKEGYGFRITPYSLADFARLAPTQIWCLFTKPETAVERIKIDPKGRPPITIEEARLHTFLQASVATTYGMQLGIPVYLIDGDRPTLDIATELAHRLLAKTPAGKDRAQG
jgi:adenylate kinase